MKKRLTHIAPLKCGLTLAALYALIAVVILPFFLIAGCIGSLAGGRSGLPALLFGIGAIFLPVLYGVLGFIFGVISAFIYNLVAQWTGGIELTLEDAAPQSVPPPLPTA